MQYNLHCRSTVMMKGESTWCENLLCGNEEPWSHWCTDGPRSKEDRSFKRHLCARSITSSCILGCSIMVVSHCPSIKTLGTFLSEPAVVQVTAAVSQGVTFSTLTAKETPNVMMLFIDASSMLVFLTVSAHSSSGGIWLQGITTLDVRFDKQALSWWQSSKLSTHLLPWWVTHHTKLWKSMVSES